MSDTTSRLNIAKKALELAQKALELAQKAVEDSTHKVDCLESQQHWEEACDRSDQEFSNEMSAQADAVFDAFAEYNNNK